MRTQRLRKAKAGVGRPSIWRGLDRHVNSTKTGAWRILEVLTRKRPALLGTRRLIEQKSLAY
jgi:hypothetical protein